MFQNSDSSELFIPADLRPEPRPFLHTQGPLDPDASHAEIQSQAQQVLEDWKRLGLLEPADRSELDEGPSVYERNPDVVWETLDEECVLVHLETAECYSLSSAGADFWRACDGRQRTSDIIAGLRETYEISEDRLEGDMQALLAGLLLHGLVRERT